MKQIFEPVLTPATENPTDAEKQIINPLENTTEKTSEGYTIELPDGSIVRVRDKKEEIAVRKQYNENK